MGLKCIKFTNGEYLVVFASDTSVYDDSVTVSNAAQVSHLNNAFVCSADLNGNILNSNLNGKTLTDYDGNTWSFELTNAQTLVLTITKPNNDTVEFTFNTYGVHNNLSYYMTVCSNVSNGTYTIGFTGYSPVNRVDSGTDLGWKWVERGYVNGYNDNTNTYIQDDIRTIKEGSGYYRTWLRSIVPGTFCHYVGMSLWGSDYSFKALDYYATPYFTGYSVTGSITLSSDTVDDAPQQPTEDPYEEGGNTGPGGGSGDLDDTSDDVDIPALPTLDATDTGFITLFNPSLSELRNLASYMWSGLFDVATFKKIFADPMDCILGLSIVPVAVPNGGSTTVKVGNISTGVSMNKAGAQYIEVNCGTLNVNEYWGAYLDYDPFTKAEIYLPYIGTHPLAVDDIMGKAVTVKYHVDILSGACTAFVKCGSSVLYTFIGQCSSSIPISGNDWTNVINGVINIAGSIGTMVATAGAAIPAVMAAGGAMASTALSSSKPSVEKSGSMSGTGGMLSVQTPYIILTRPKQAVPANQNRFTGYPAFITVSLGSISGYTEVESIHLEGIPGTQQECEEIETLLKGGVIL